MDGWKTRFLSGWPIFRGYVSFRECNSDHHDQSIFLLDACPTTLFDYCNSIPYGYIPHGWGSIPVSVEEKVWAKENEVYSSRFIKITWLVVVGFLGSLTICPYL